jgi:hypothetical protein
MFSARNKRKKRFPERQRNIFAAWLFRLLLEPFSAHWVGVRQERSLQEQYRSPVCQQPASLRSFATIGEHHFLVTDASTEIILLASTLHQNQGREGGTPARQKLLGYPHQWNENGVCQRSPYKDLSLRQQNQNVMKSGLNHAKSQRYRYQACYHYFTIDPKLHDYDLVQRKRALQLYLEGTSLQATGRPLGIHHQSMSNRITEAATALPTQITDQAPKLPL